MLCYLAQKVILPPQGGVVLPGIADGVCGNEKAAYPANTINARMDERSNAFMGRSPVFFTLVFSWWLENAP
jgi:hypothetical protein